LIIHWCVHRPASNLGLERLRRHIACCVKVRRVGRSRAALRPNPSLAPPGLSRAAQREVHLELAVKLRDMLSPAHSPQTQQTVLRRVAQCEALSAHSAELDGMHLVRRSAARPVWCSPCLEYST
jgi:hypothetical protein